MKRNKVLTIGEILVEIVAVHKGEGFSEPQPLIGPFPSGAPAIFIDQVARLGTECAIISRVGADDFGQLNIRRLAADGVDVSGIAVAPGESTGSAFVRYGEDGSRRFVFNIIHSACRKIESSPATDALLHDCTHLHLMGTALISPDMRQAALHAVEVCKARGVSVSFDPNLRAETADMPGLQDALHQVLRHTDILLPSGEELFLFTRAKDEQGAVRELLARGIGEIVVKRGKQGAGYFSAKQQAEVLPLQVKEVDPTGAGDCFDAAFISFRLNGASVAEALRYANAAGAHAVTCTGPMEGAATRATTLQAFLRRHENLLA